MREFGTERGAPRCNVRRLAHRAIGDFRSRSRRARQIPSWQRWVGRHGHAMSGISATRHPLRNPRAPQRPKRLWNGYTRASRRPRTSSKATGSLRRLGLPGLTLPTIAFSRWSENCQGPCGCAPRPFSPQTGRVVARTEQSSSSVQLGASLRFVIARGAGIQPRRRAARPHLQRYSPLEDAPKPTRSPPFLLGRLLNARSITFLHCSTKRSAIDRPIAACDKHACFI